MMKLTRLSKKSEPKQKKFTITATKTETGLTPEQEVDVLYRVQRLSKNCYK